MESEIILAAFIIYSTWDFPKLSFQTLKENRYVILAEKMLKTDGIFKKTET